MFYQGNVWVPRRSVTNILKLAQYSKISGHLGVSKNISRLENYNWRQKRGDVKRCIEGCSICPLNKDHAEMNLFHTSSLEVHSRR